MEELWGKYETPMKPVFDALDNDRPEMLHAKRTEITDFVALHFVRSLEVQRIHKESLARVERQTRANREMQARLSNAKYGLDLSKAPSILDKIGEEVLAPIQTMEEQGSLFQDWIEGVFQQTRQHLSQYSLSIRPVTQSREYLLGDCPSVGIASGMDPRNRPPLLDARAIILPLNPRFAVMVYPPGPDDPMFSVDTAGDDVVSPINHGQIAQAHKRVYYRPGSGHASTVRNYLNFPQP
ncbi:hypothetical protein J2S89_002723 [Arthrobacter bambusae]|nr:DUF4238 domain-containing protein [Arthrobacter bambusae]MDQ0030884.1 hypothetical protein [Arthrobacter bambusae]MDQ0099249.1 hypothetical protein [Arthrobacter bambusae]